MTDSICRKDGGEREAERRDLLLGMRRHEDVELSL